MMKFILKFLFLVLISNQLVFAKNLELNNLNEVIKTYNNSSSNMNIFVKKLYSGNENFQKEALEYLQNNKIKTLPTLTILNSKIQFNSNGTLYTGSLGKHNDHEFEFFLNGKSYIYDMTKTLTQNMDTYLSTPKTSMFLFHLIVPNAHAQLMEGIGFLVIVLVGFSSIIMSSVHNQSEADLETMKKKINEIETTCNTFKAVGVSNDSFAIKAVIEKYNDAISEFRTHCKDSEKKFEVVCKKYKHSQKCISSKVNNLKINDSEKGTKEAIIYDTNEDRILIKAISK